MQSSREMNLRRLEKICDVISVLRNEERVGVQNRSSIYLLKNRIQRWYKHIAKAGIY